MSMPPDEGEDILAFGPADPPASGPRRRLLLGAASGTVLAGAAIAVGLLASGGGAPPAAHHQDTVTQQYATSVTQGYYSGTVPGAGRLAIAPPRGAVRVVTLNASTGRPTCHHP